MYNVGALLLIGQVVFAQCTQTKATRIILVSLYGNVASSLCATAFASRLWRIKAIIYYDSEKTKSPQLYKYEFVSLWG
jgi:hypothetical protein